MGISAADEANMAEEVSLGIRPTDQTRDWRRRWTEVQRDLDRLETPRSGQLSAEAIQAARHELHSSYTQAYHIKDALKVEHPSLESQIEDAISTDPTLALLADLANVEKHVQLTRNPRSGDVPSITVQGVQAGSGKGGWRLEAKIVHKGKHLDGMQIASAAVASWRAQLERWGLISPT